MYETRTLGAFNGKGGVGKTTVIASLGASLARAKRRVLIVDLDPDTNLGKDLGYTVWIRPTVAHDKLKLTEALSKCATDDGRALADALASQDASRLLVLKDVRPGLDVLPGGPFLADLTELPESYWQRRGHSRKTVLRNLLDEIAEPYDVILIDTGPGHLALQEMAAVAARFAICPTRSDEGSIGSLSKIAKVFELVFDEAPDVELLGVVMFGVGSSATRVQLETRAKIESVLGTVAPVFKSTIRHTEQPATACRELGVVPYELVELAPHLPKFYEKGYRKDQVKVTDSAKSLAEDLEQLAIEIAFAHHQRVTELEEQEQEQETSK